MQPVCRICLSENNINLHCLFAAHLSYKIEALAQIEINKNDGLSTMVCKDCINNINQSYEVRKQIINSYYRLKSWDIKDKNIKKEIVTSDKIDNDAYVEPEVNVIVDDTPEDICDNEDTVSENNDLTENEIIENSKSISKTPFSNSTVENRIVCNVCGLSITKINMQKHLITHSDNQTVFCNVCGKAFKNTESYRCHQLMHVKEHSVCEFCGKEFQYKGMYIRHVRLHTRVIPIVICTVCGKKCDNKNIKRHMQTHTGDRPYYCKYCQKGFVSAYTLKVHTRQHTDEFPFICNQCPASFHQKVSLKTHLQNKHSLTPEEIKDFFDKEERKRKENTSDLVS